MMVWEAIYRLSTRVVFTYYLNQDDIAKDNELQTWAAGTEML